MPRTLAGFLAGLLLASSLVACGDGEGPGIPRPTRTPTQTPSIDTPTPTRTPTPSLEPTPEPTPEPTREPEPTSEPTEPTREPEPGTDRGAHPEPEPTPNRPLEVEPTEEPTDETPEDTRPTTRPTTRRPPGSGGCSRHCCSARRSGSPCWCAPGAGPRGAPNWPRPRVSWSGSPATSCPGYVRPAPASRSPVDGRSAHLGSPRPRTGSRCSSPAPTTRAAGPAPVMLRDAARQPGSGWTRLVAPGPHDTWALDLDTVMLDLETALGPPPAPSPA